MEELVADDLHQVEKNRNKKRFNDEQIKSLESTFETESKLQSWKKVQIAKELGLHPRQVAIWFQNKRARWKSKQLEHDYEELKADYDSLLSKFEILKNEKQSLFSQLQALREQLGQSSKRINTDSDRVNVERLDFTREGPETPVLGGECVYSFRTMEQEDWNIPQIPDIANGYLDLQEKWDNEHRDSFSGKFSEIYEYENLLLEKT